MFKTLHLIIFSLLLLTNFLYSIDRDNIPPSLIEWQNWVLDDVKDRECPIDYQSGDSRCSWFRDINISLDGNKLDFNISITLYKNQTKVPLPSVHLSWVESVMVDSKRAIVLDNQSKATLILDKGVHTISGSIILKDNVKYIQLPQYVVLVNLYKDGQKVSNLSIDKNSKLWLDKSGSSKIEKGTLSVSIYRTIIDGHPLKMKSYLHLSVSGKMRSAILDGIVLDKFLPTAISSSLDATIIDNNRLKVELKAGEWEIMIDSYTPYNLTALNKSKGEFIYDNQEVWSMESNPNYRTVEINGATPIDPAQTSLPQEWRVLPTYLVDDKVFNIKELYKSAKQQQKNKFNLKRHIWLDFDGGGYTISDNISAKISQIRRLESSNILDLGSISINNKPTLITTLDGSLKKGVELREENLDIEAYSRYNGDITMLPISGWNEKFSSITTTLHLPIGWELFASFGSDKKGSAWVDKWDLMDIFLVMLLAIGIYQMYGIVWSIPATLFIILLWHESDDAPTMIWLSVLLFVALLRVLEEGRLRSIIKFFMSIVLIITISKVLSFSIYEIRTALYPQLEKVNYSNSAIFSPILETNRAYQEKKILRREKEIIDYMESSMPMPLPKISKSQNQIMQNRIDPNAVVQTGVGKPTWSWNSHNFYWQSAVGSDERLELWFISPTISKILKVLNIIGMLFLLYMFLREFTKSITVKLNRDGAKIWALILILNFYPNTLKADIPSNDMLIKLKEKLITPPTCLPNCASIERVRLDIIEDVLDINLDISAGTNISLPIFGNRNIWLPTTVMVDGKVANINIDNSGELWVMLSKGVHKINLNGSIKGYEKIMLSSLLSLHNLKTTSSNKLWSISSDYKSYIEINNLKEQKVREKEKSKVQPMIEVSRTLYFGQRWYIDTEVKLLNYINKPYTLTYKLLKNESILNKDIELKDSNVILHLDNKNSYYNWRSSLPITKSLELNFDKNSKHSEIWKMDISSIWDIKYDGLEAIEQLKIGTILMPLFKPWQGDKLKLTMEKAKAVKGENLTIQSSQLKIIQSSRYRDITLDLNLKSSKAGQYSIIIDGIKELKPTIIDDKTHYLKINGGKVSIPLQAKSQKVKISWREEIGSDISYQFPHIKLNKESVNSNISLTLPYNRWILWSSGPTLGPAVLIWGVILALILFAIILGRFKGTPLKSSDWVLLGLGVSTTSIFIMIPVIIWIFALKFREQKSSSLKGGYRNLYQILLVILTFIALSTIISAVSIGLLGNPDMMIMGNSSYGGYLNWYSDRIYNDIAQPTIISLSIWYYRVLMLIWAIWIAFSLIKWLKWAWIVFSSGNIWVKREKRVRI